MTDHVFVVLWEGYLQGVFSTFDGASAKIEERCPGAVLEDILDGWWSDTSWRVQVKKVEVQ